MSAKKIIDDAKSLKMGGAFFRKEKNIGMKDKEYGELIKELGE